MLFFGSRRTLALAGVVLIVLAWASLQAQDRTRIQQGPDGPVIIRNGVVLPFRGPGGAKPSIPVTSPGRGPDRNPGDTDKREGNHDSEASKEAISEKSPEGQDDKDKDKTDQEGSKPSEGATVRPTVPPESPDPEVLKARPNEEGKVRLSFKGHGWEDVLEWVADISQMSLDWQELPEGYLNLITQDYYTVAEARDLINRHLLARGYTMLIQDEVISVCRIESVNSAMVPRVEPEELENCRPYEFVRVSFPLDWLIAAEAVDELKPMISPNGKLTALRATNRLEAMDAAINLQQVYQVLKEEQSDSGQDRLVREFPLKNCSAEEVVEQLNTLLGIETKGASPAGPMTPQQMEAMQRQAQMEAERAKKGGVSPVKKTEIFLLADKRHNSVVANAPPDKMAVIAEAIEILDISPVGDRSIVDTVNRVQIYRLENLAPKAVIKMIEEMGSLDHTARLEADEENKAIIVSASLVDHVTVRTLVDRLDRGGRRSVVLPLRQLRAEMVVKQVDFVMGGAQAEDESSQGGDSYDPFSRYRSYSSRSRGSQAPQRPDRFRISADVKNNALVLWCNEFELKKVEDLISQFQTMPETKGGMFEVRVYRLNTLDPEPLVQTLEDMDALGVHASLEADKESKSIVAYANEAGHKKIRDLIERLDSSGRKFEVVQLRRLQADYVAGTIQFMMAPKEKESSNSGRYYWDYSRGRENEEKDQGGFKVEADVESNRLLMLASDAEMNEVMNLLVKLGEIPADGADPSTVRVIDTLPGPEMERLLRQLEQAWPSVAPNPLILPDGEDDGKEKAKAATTSPEGSKADTSSNTALSVPRGSRLRFVEYEKTVPRESKSDTPQETGAEPPAAEQSAGQAESAHVQPVEDSPTAAGNGKATSAGDVPVNVSIGPDGRIVIASQDTAALDRLEELVTHLMPERPDYRIFHLKYAWAFSVALTLEEVFQDKEEQTSRPGSRTYYNYYGAADQKDDSVRLSKRRPIKFISDDTSNTILVQNADPAQLKVIGELIEFYDQPEPSDSQSVRITEVVKIKFSKASLIAESVKEVYRDLLSANDKSLANGNNKTPERNYTYLFDSSGGDDEKKTPSFKGLLSLGVDDLSNTLIVSAPAYFITDVLAVIEKLDKAAEPTTETIEVVTLGDGIDAANLQQTLMRLLQQRSSPGKSDEAAKPREKSQKDS